MQIKVTVAAPALISTGSISMDLDPAVFGAIASVAVFSATDDQIGYASVNAQHLEAHFSSTSGGIGQLPGLPVLAVSVPVLPGGGLLPQGTVLEIRGAGFQPGTATRCGH